jgi:hypothetical protein
MERIKISRKHPGVNPPYHEKSLKNRQNYAKMRETKEKDGRAHEQPGV